MQANMAEVPANPNDNPHRYSRFWFRLFEILPGAIVWICLTGPFVLAYYYPLEVTIFVLLFDVYWLLKAISYAFILSSGYRHFKKTVQTNWMERLEELDQLSPEDQIKHDLIPWRDLYHAIILTTYKEGADILHYGLDSIANADYPPEKIIVILATEARAGAEDQQIAKQLAREYRSSFHKFLVSVHPDGIRGEVKAKGANATWAARQITVLLESEGIPLENVIVSTADADSRFHPQYFANLSYTYLTTEKRTQAAYQPVAMYFNNIWKAPMSSRIMAFSTTFWQLMESIRQYRLISFSTHSTSLKTLKDSNYWCTSIVNEDSRQFFRAYFHYGGKFRVIPLFMPMYMDAVHVPGRKASLRNLYLQQQRWAYGAEHFPYIVLESWRRKDIPFGSRFLQVFRAFSGSYSWATSAFFLTVVGWLPILLSPTFQQHVTSSNFPIVTKYLLSLTWIGLLASGIVTLKLLNTAFPKKKALSALPMLLQWLFVPITSIIFGAAPGIDSLTRLMLGRYLGFRVTEKAKA